MYSNFSKEEEEMNKVVVFFAEGFEDFISCNTQARVDELYKKNQELEERLAKLESILLNKN